MAKTTPEGYVLASVLEYLAVKKIFAMRMNSGAIRMENQHGRTRVFRGHEPGTADVLALRVEKIAQHVFLPSVPVWIECKAPNGKQSELQKEFQQRVEAEGHRYILAYSIDDLEAAGL